MPQIHFLRAINTLTNHTANLAEFVKVQAIDAAKAKGQNVTVRQASLDKAKVSLTELIPAACLK
jgi:hypothetical protein